MRVGVVAHRDEPTNAALVAAWRELGLDALLVSPDDALAGLGPGDVALIRLDVLDTVDGIEPGLARIPDLRFAGVRILNPPAALLAAHDKLWTEQRLRAAGLPRPELAHVLSSGDPVDVRPPFVVKPRYGSWGREVRLCETEQELRRLLVEVEPSSWFRRQGALVQHLVDRPASDIRVLVAGERVVGASARVPAPGEWRTNISLGGSLAPVELEAETCGLAVAATAALGGDLMGVDLLPAEDGFVVLEVNGAPDFDGRYSLPGGDVYEDAAAALGLLPSRAPGAALAASRPG